MGEVMLKVPAAYTGTLRSAVLEELDFLTRTAKQGVAEIQEARENRDHSRAAFREGDLGDAQRSLGETAALVDQLPAPGSTVTAELRGRRSAIASLTEEAARVCAKALAGELDPSPLDVDSARAKLQELDWWISEHERREAARLAEHTAEARS